MGSAALAAASWQCQWCSHMNSAEKNKRRCFLCQGWWDGIAPSTRISLPPPPTLTRCANRAADAAEGPRGGGGIDASCPKCADNNGPYGIDFGPLSLSLLPPLDKFCIPGSAFGREEEDEDGDGKGPRGREEQ
jgi:hypothetical protein